MRKEILLERLVSFFGADFENPHLIGGIPLAHKGLDIQEPKRSVGGRKESKDFLLDDGSLAVKQFYNDLIEDDEIVAIEIITEYYFADGSLWFSKEEIDKVRDIDKLIRSRYDSAYTFLRKSAKGTAIEFHVNEILRHFASEVSVWLLGDSYPFLQKLDNSGDQTIDAYLNIVIHESGKKVIDSIKEQLTGEKWLP